MSAHRTIPHVLQQSPFDAEALENARDKAVELERAARTFIRNNPTVAVAGAVAVGFLIGRLVMR